MINVYTKKFCQFCRKKIEEIDYQDTQTLRRYMSSWSKIRPASNTGNCKKHQRQLTQAIKRARFLAMLPYITR